jgi:hypothetical protein
VITFLGALNSRACFGLLVWGILLAAFISCRTVAIKREIRNTGEIASIGKENRYIKTHMYDGTVYIMHGWKLNKHDNLLTGYGKHLDINRRLIEEREAGRSGQTVSSCFTVPVDDIALIETNDPGPSIAGGLAVVTGVTAGFAVYCLINPKACFGSCPTFYAFNGDSLVLMAEGFSESVTPSLEDRDIDMLYHAVPNETMNLRLTNEALETHVIRNANLLIAEKNEDQRVFATSGGSFLLTHDIVSPEDCKISGISCLDKVLYPDGVDYFSETDPGDLNTKEELLLNFRNPGPGNKGLIIGKRQTLLTTYLMYQGLSYMGNSVSYWMAEIERGNLIPETTIFDLLGSIEIYIKTRDGEWVYEGEVHETGPIATDFNIVPLTTVNGEDLELKLVMNKGLWRINYLALASVIGEVEPVVIGPHAVKKIKGAEEQPLDKLLDENDYLVTYPGDIYDISYDLPFINAELFLDSRGYYLEWIRDEWVEEQSLRNFRLMVRNPERYLRIAAKKFKEIEPLMEETFWNSRYVEK